MYDLQGSQYLRVYFRLPMFSMAIHAGKAVHLRERKIVGILWNESVRRRVEASAMRHTWSRTSHENGSEKNKRKGGYAGNTQLGSTNHALTPL